MLCSFVFMLMAWLPSVPFRWVAHPRRSGCVCMCAGCSWSCLARYSDFDSYIGRQCLEETSCVTRRRSCLPNMFTFLVCLKIYLMALMVYFFWNGVWALLFFIFLVSIAIGSQRMGFVLRSEWPSLILSAVYANLSAYTYLPLFDVKSWKSNLSAYKSNLNAYLPQFATKSWKPNFSAYIHYVNSRNHENFFGIVT